MPLINTASKVYKGSNLATKVYRGTVQVWPPVAAFGPDQYSYGSGELPTTVTTFGPGSFGTQVDIAATGRITGMRYYWDATSADAPRLLHLWNVAGTSLATVSVPRGGAGSVGWQSALFTTPIVVTAGQQFVAAFDLPGTDPCSRMTNPVSNVVNGDLTRIQQGYTNPVSGQMPNQAFARNLFADLIFQKALVSYGPDQTLYTTETPAAPIVGGPAARGVDIQFAVAGRITALRVYRTASGSAIIRTLRLWDASGGVLGSATTDATAGPGWKTAILAAPVAVTAAQIVRVSYDQDPADNYARTTGGPPPITNGDLSMLGTAWHYTGTVPNRPTSIISVWYFIDVIFQKAL